jgi:multidrug efflux system membrane fusion protein
MKPEKSRLLKNGVKIPLAMLVVAALLLLCVVGRARQHPRTDDASVRANYVQFAPEVTGRIVRIPVRENAFVSAGDVLFAIDPRPYEYALDQALSDQQLLEEQITDTQRRIAAQNSAVVAARAGVTGSRTETATVASATQAAVASVRRAKAALQSAEAQQMLAQNNLHRIEPLLAKQYVTAEQVDDARTRARVAEQNYQQAHAALDESYAQEARSRSMQREAEVGVTVSEAKLEESIHAVDRLDSLQAQRSAKAAKVEGARLDLERCTVKAPFDGYVTNLNISEGEMAKPGVPLFTLIDARKWYVVANYRESELRNIKPGMHVDIYLMSNASQRFDGVVESIGNGVSPDDSETSNGLPQIDHTLNWVHLAARFPTRIRVLNPDPSLFRMGETAISIVR